MTVDAHLCGEKHQVRKLNKCPVNVNIFSTIKSVIDLNLSKCGNGFLKNTYKCKSKRCKLKVNFVSRDQALQTKDFTIALFLLVPFMLNVIARMLSI